MTDVPVDVDLNDDGSHDSLFAAHFAGFTNGPKSGTLYLIYNFPHTISLTATSKDEITGTVVAPDSVTAVSGVQYNYKQQRSNQFRMDCLYWHH